MGLRATLEVWAITGGGQGVLKGGVKGLLQKVELVEPTFQELLVLYRQKPKQKLPAAWKQVRLRPAPSFVLSHSLAASCRGVACVCAMQALKPLDFFRWCEGLGVLGLQMVFGRKEEDKRLQYQTRSSIVLRIYKDIPVSLLPTLSCSAVLCQVSQAVTAMCWGAFL